MSRGIWLPEIIEAMEALGGDASYKDLNKKIKERANIPGLTTRKDWEAQIRGTIEKFSSDSKVFKKAKKVAGGKEDIFFSVDGIGKGHWGLRNSTISQENVNLTEDDIGYPEGKKALRQHICRERNPAVIAKAKALFKQKHNGKLYCEACGFSFDNVYGKLGENFIEGHHKIPISKLQSGSKTNPKDIIMLCSNCHKMIHRLTFNENSLEKLKEIINTNTQRK